jgi:photoactive yellow protein
MVLTATTYERASSLSGREPSSREGSSVVLPFGLFELDAAGMVIRYSPASENAPTIEARDIWGRNFFTEIAPVEQVVGFRLRFHSFMASGQAVERFTTTFAHGEQNIKVQIMMAHITEKSEDGRKRLALVRIMPE